MIDKDLCVTVHVYGVVELSDGTRYLDICAPETPDEKCRFTIVSLWEDHAEVGDVGGFRNRDVHIRGLILPMHGRTGMLLSHARQFNGGPPKFMPNPQLAHGFTGEQDRPPISDPSLRSQGGRRAFMNTRSQEAIPRK
jgi:hypothetical protein